MNWLLIIILAELVLSILMGYHKGFLKMTLSLLSIVILLIFSTIATPFIEDVLVNRTSLVQMVEEKCVAHFENIEGAKIEEKTASTIEERQKELADAGIVVPMNILEKAVEDSPELLRQSIVSTGFYSLIAHEIALYVVHGIAVVLAWILGAIILGIVGVVFDIATKLPGIRQANHFLGMASGLVFGVVLMWVFFYIISITCTSSFGIMMMQYIQNSPILTCLYMQNPLLFV